MPTQIRRPFKDLRSGLPYPYKKSATLENIINYRKEDDEDIGVYSDAYKCASWFYIGKREEIRVWGQRILAKDGSKAYLKQLDSNEVTITERDFKRHYEAVTHRMIHRKASIEMYKKILEKSFAIEKSVTIVRNNGEFGFRIHGSRPVVVSAIEKGTPAETCGLEVGDIVVSLNDINVLDVSHSEVVRLAHAGSDTLKLDLVPTCAKLKIALKENQEEDEIHSGFLYRQISVKEKINEWRKRWFSLRTDCCLYWYQFVKDSEPMGIMNLQNCCASYEYNEEDSGKHLIRLEKYDGPVTYLYSTEQELASRWIQQINAAANKLTRSNPYIEKTLRCIHVKPMAIKDWDCRGNLAILDQKRKLWKQRYFVLKDACFYSYADVASSTALGVFYLHGYKVQSSLVIGKKNTFEIIPWDGKSKHLWLMAESEIDKKRWLAALEYSIDRWIKLN